MTGHRSLHVLAVPLLALALAGPARADGDAGTFARLGFDDRPQVCQFLETVALREEYADRGLHFTGPADRDGGGVLAYCSFFLVNGWTPPNFLAFNETTEYLDGGIPRDPQTIFFDPPTNFVQGSVGSFVEVGFPATMRAFATDGTQLASTTVKLEQFAVPLRVEAPGIARVRFEAPGARYILDDLLWGDSAGGDLSLTPASLAVTLEEGESATVVVDVGNAAAHPLSFFVRERPGLAAAGAAARSVVLEKLGDPIVPANLREPREATPVRRRQQPRHADDPRLLVYTEFDPDDFNGDTDLDQALRSLDVPYTAVYASIPVFRETLAEGGWDAVIFDHQLAFFYEPWFAVYDELLAFVRAGGILIMGTWQIAERSDHPLWGELGFQWLENYETPEPVAWTEADPRFFTVPNDVPDFIELGDFYVADGHRTAALPGGTVLARLVGKGQGADAMILANGGRTLYRAFLDGPNVVDRDGDGVLDTIELWRDLLIQMLADDLPWLAATPEAVVPAGGALELGVTLDAAGLAPGDHDARLELRSNEAVHDTYVLPVRLTVTADPTAAPAAAAMPLDLRAFPNPFNPATTLAFELATSGPVSLVVHDAAGRRVRALVDGAILPAGAHALRWDGRDEAGRPVAAGVYLARLAAGDATTLARLVLVR